jgi:hypothetical protein
MLTRFRHVASQAKKDKAELKADTVFQMLQNATPAQAATYVENNVNSLAEAKDFLKVLAKIVVILAKNID